MAVALLVLRVQSSGRRIVVRTLVAITATVIIVMVIIAVSIAIVVMSALPDDQQTGSRSVGIVRITAGEAGDDPIGSLF
jgi:hypothetical protein